MKLLSYTSTRSGFKGLGSLLVRWRLRSEYSHTEMMFEPGDGVEHLVPDGSLEPDADGAYWCASSTATDPMPSYSPRRAGRSGGVRFKRIVPETSKWVIQDLSEKYDPVATAQWFKIHEGECYDWKHILSFIGTIVNLLLQQSTTKWTCTEACGAALGFHTAEIFDPRNLPVVVDRINELLTEPKSIRSA